MAAESLGVPVYTMKYIGVVISGALAGLAGSSLVIVGSNYYRENQTGGRGFIGLAAMIFGNWRPGGLAAGAALFGYADGLQLREKSAVHGLLLFVALLLLLVGLRALWRRQMLSAVLSFGAGALFAVWFAASNVVPSGFVVATPYITTLLVLALASQRLRPPAADGRPVPTRAAARLTVDWAPSARRGRDGCATPTRRTPGCTSGPPALVDDGRVITGCNVENASYGLGLCAECSLVSVLNVTGGGRLVAVSVVAGDGAVPRAVRPLPAGPVRVRWCRSVDRRRRRG